MQVSPPYVAMSDGLCTSSFCFDSRSRRWKGAEKQVGNKEDDGKEFGDRYLAPTDIGPSGSELPRQSTGQCSARPATPNAPL